MKTPAETTPDVRELFFKGGQEEKPVAYFCGNCRMVIHALEIHWDGTWHKEPPKRCYTCDSTRCKKGHVVDPRSYCSPCSSESRYRKNLEDLAEATVVTDHDGFVWHDDHYYRDVDELYYEDEVPERAFCSTEHRPQFEASEILEGIEENAMVDDYEFEWTDVPELQAFVDAWLEKQTIRWYEEDRSRCVVLEKAPE